MSNSVDALQGQALRFAILGAVLVCACNNTPTRQEPEELILRDVDTLISQDSAVLARPVDVAVDDRGHVYVLDQRDARVVAVEDDGAVVHFAGRHGQGPGEFDSPASIGVAAGRVRVFDVSTRAVQMFRVDDASYVETVTPDFIGGPFRVSFGPHGGIAYSSTELPGLSNALAATLDERGGEARLFGELVSEQLGPEGPMRDAARSARLPEFLRNYTLPVFATDGSVWVIQHTEAVAQHYGADGSLLRTVELEVPEMEEIRRAFFEWFEPAEAARRFRVFESVEDAAVTDGRMWILWNLPRDRLPVVTVHDETGGVRARFVLDGVEMGRVWEFPAVPPRRHFAVDEANNRIVLLDETTLAAYSLPSQATWQ